ncbi:MAG: cysteine desulfurase NifS [Lentisphaeria bacterium]
MPDKKIIYVDNNATTQMAPEVLDAMMPFMTEYYGNPSSTYPFSKKPADGIRSARKSMAELLGCDPAEIIFTSCGSESDNTAIRSALATQSGRKKIVTTAVEHPAILNLCRNLEKQGFPVVYLGVDSKGRLNMDEVHAAIDEDTAIVSVMHANNETGTIFPIVELAEIAHQNGALFHTDAVQSVGKVPICLRETKIDFLSLSGHKFHAPKGVGVLYRRRNTPYKPLLIGGHQERAQRAGTENVTNIIGLGKAADLLLAGATQEIAHIRKLRDRMEQGILASCPDTFVNGDLENRLPGTSNIAFQYIEGEAILLHLYHDAGICASSGSACTSDSLEASHVLQAMGLPFQSLHGSVRFSFSRYNTEEDVDVILAAMPKIVKTLRDLSPFGRMNESK